MHNNNNNNEQHISIITKKYKYISSYLLVFIFLISSSIETANARSFRYKKNYSTVYIQTGQSEVKANELVYGQPATYPVDYKLSHLIWDVKNISTVVAGLNVDVGNEYTLNLEGKFNVDEGKGTMDDYDWQDIGNDWSDWSHHDDTDVTGINGLDVSLDYNLVGKRDNKLSLLIGYSDELWAWESRGGSYIYSSSGILRDNIGTFTAGQPVITYEQRFKMPYLGLKYSKEFNDWKFDFRYDYSNQVKVTARDYHILRNLIFEDDFNKGVMNAYKLAVGYRLSKKFGLNVTYNYREYDEVRGNTLYINSNTGGIIGGCINCAGADNTSQSWSAGISYTY